MVLGCLFDCLGMPLKCSDVGAGSLLVTVSVVRLEVGGVVGVI